MDRDVLRQKIRHRLQVNGFSNQDAQSEDAIAASVDECERQLDHVVKLTLQKVIHDLLTIRRNSTQQVASRLQ
jgi:hypothetical protein